MILHLARHARPWSPAALAAVAGLTTLAALAAPASAVSPVTPHVVAKPNSVMVNTKTTLIGTGFNANTVYTAAECSETGWIVPKDPCANNEVNVKTNAKGAFKASMTAMVCPAAVPVTAGFAEKCYVGILQPSGVDTVELLGASVLTVTGP